MDHSYFRVLKNKLMNKDPDVVPEHSPLIILDINPDMCMSNNSKDTKHTRHSYRRMKLNSLLAKSAIYFSFCI